MKAIVCTKYGSPEVLELQELPKPSPKDQEVLVRIHATTVTAADSMMRRADPFISRFFLGFNKPKNPITGTGFAGKIEAVGKDVKKFKVGEEVFGETGVTFGANAEYVCVAEAGVIRHKSPEMSFEEAATICDGVLTSYNFLTGLAKVQRGHKVLIIGASGSLGTAAVQLAHHVGANVTGICSTSNIALVKSLGADAVIDYTRVDFTKTGEKYDIIYDTVGKSSFSKSKSSLRAKGQYISPIGGFSMLLDMLWTSMFGKKKAKFSATGFLPAPDLLSFLEEIENLFSSGKIKSVIDRYYPLSQVADAHRYVDKGHKKGNVVIQVA